MDVQAIPRPADSYDFISLSQVMEFVPDDRRAFAELSRIGSDDLIIHIAFGSTMRSARSTHFDEPLPPYGRYHDYGLDVVEHFGAPTAGFTALMVCGVDPVTNVSEYLHFFCRQSTTADLLREAFDRAVPGSIAKIWPAIPQLIENRRNA